MKTNMLLVAAPSGGGKNSFINRIRAEVPGLYYTITYTTREKREGESEGDPYHFISKEKFEELVESNFFVEWANVHTNYYGTSQDEVCSALEDGKVLIMDVDIQGVRTFKAKFPQAVSIFIMPPSLEELKVRIVNRPGGPPADIDTRLVNAKIEMEESKKFDHIVINDQFEPSFKTFKDLVISLI